MLVGCGGSDQPVGNDQLAARAFPDYKAVVTCRDESGAIAGREFNRVCYAVVGRSECVPGSGYRGFQCPEGTKVVFTREEQVLGYFRVEKEAFCLVGGRTGRTRPDC
jgi:hypothetical protein